MLLLLLSLVILALLTKADQWSGLFEFFESSDPSRACIKSRNCRYVDKFSLIVRICFSQSVQAWDLLSFCWCRAGRRILRYGMNGKEDKEGNWKFNVSDLVISGLCQGEKVREMDSACCPCRDYLFVLAFSFSSLSSLLKLPSLGWCRQY